MDPALRTRFAQEWGGGRRNSASGMTAASLAEVLADAGRFAVPPAGEIGSEVAAMPEHGAFLASEAARLAEAA